MSKTKETRKASTAKPKAGPGRNGKAARPKANAKDQAALIEAANEATLRAWKHIYAKRDRFGKVL